LFCFILFCFILFYFILLYFTLFYLFYFILFVLFYFILFFENRLIPTLFLILSWGYQPEPAQVDIYLLFYTLLASLPLLFGILFIYNSLFSLCLFLLSGNNSLVGGL